MSDKTKEQLINELITLRQRIEYLEKQETDLKREEQALKNSEEKWRLLFKNTPMAIFIYDTDLRITDCNDITIDNLLSSRDKLMGLDLKTLKDQRILPAIRKTLEGDKGYYEGSDRATTGPAELWISLRTAPIFDRNGRITGGVGIVQDITKHIRMENSLFEQKRFAENLMENSAVATFVLDPHHKVLTWNKACEELTGIPAAEMIGTDKQWKAFYDHERPCLADIVIDADFDRLSDLYAVYAKSTLASNALHAEGWYPNLNKKNRYILFDAAPIYDSKGKLVAVIETLQCITERKLAEEALKKNEENFRQLIERIPIAIAVADKKGNFIFFNCKFVETFGYTIEDIPSVDAWWLLAYPNEEYRAKVMHSWRAAASKAIREGKETESREWRVTCKDGSFRDIEFRMASIKDSNIVIYHDITERKTLEQQLIQSQKMEAIGQLAGGIAHDFNNILSAIMGYATLIQISPKEDLKKTYTDQILELSDRAASLTRSLLAFSRKQRMDLRVADMNEIVETTSKLLIRVIGEDIELRTKLSDENILVFVDRGQIEQVLINLVTNARDALPKGGTITMSTEQIEIDRKFVELHGYGEIGKYALLSVTDTGIGMNENVKERIFEPFYTTKEVGKGSGLGLAMVYGIIKEHKGFVNVYSELGKGTIFRIYIPTMQFSTPKAETEEQFLMQGGTETILLAEDDARLREVVKTLLEESGYKVIEAEDGEDAVKQFMRNKNRIDLLITDVVMPKKNGMEAYREIQRARPGVKTLFTSGYTGETVQKQELLDEGLDLISKPISQKQLLKKVREILDK
ncbi:MAG: PAS domain S-box protein [Dissulfurispiraceae bacterium]